MSDSSILMKIVAFVAIIAVFEIAIGGTPVSGFSSFQTAIATDPTSGIPTFPSAPGNVSNANEVRSYLWTNPGTNCPAGVSRDYQPDSPPSSPSTSVNVTTTSHWTGITAAFLATGYWRLNGTLDVPFAGVGGTGATLRFQVRLYAQSGCTLITTLVDETLAFTTGTVSFEIGTVITDYDVSAGTNLAVTLSRSLGNQGIMLFLDGSLPAIFTVTYLLESGAPGCDVVTFCLNIVAYWFAFIASWFIYIGSVVFWIVAAIVGMFLWFATVTVTLFSGLATMFIYLIAGAGVPVPMSYFFTVIFLACFVFIFFLVLKTIRGSGP